VRIFIALIAGLLIALLLFLLDAFLVRDKHRYGDDIDAVTVVEFVRVHKDEFTQFKKRQPPKKPEPPKQPPPPSRRVAVTQDSDVNVTPLNIDVPDIDIGAAGGSGPYIGSWTGTRPNEEGEAIPIVRINPRYPRRALLEGIEGWVRLEFTIVEDGTVKDVRIAESEPPKIFDRDAIQAVLKWKFKPRVIDGKAVPRRATSTVEFTLIDEEQ
jgi:protein TonB